MRVRHFSHRKRDGVSVGITIHNNTAFLAVAFRNNMDTFNRRLVDTILRGRIEKAIKTNNSNSVNMVQSFPLTKNVEQSELMFAFRKRFKPDPLEERSDFLKETAFNSATNLERLTYIQTLFIAALDEVDP